MKIDLGRMQAAAILPGIDKQIKHVQKLKRPRPSEKAVWIAELKGAREKIEAAIAEWDESERAHQRKQAHEALLTDEPGKVTRLTGPRSVMSPGHDYEPGEERHPMHTDPLCRICGQPKKDAYHG